MLKVTLNKIFNTKNSNFVTIYEMLQKYSEILYIYFFFNNKIRIIIS